MGKNEKFNFFFLQLSHRWKIQRERERGKVKIENIFFKDDYHCVRDKRKIKEKV